MNKLCNICHDRMSLLHFEWMDCGHNSYARRVDKEKRANAFH